MPLVAARMIHKGVEGWIYGLCSLRIQSTFTIAEIDRLAAINVLIARTTKKRSRPEPFAAVTQIVKGTT